MANAGNTLEETIEFAIDGFDDVHHTIQLLKAETDNDIEQLKAMMAENKVDLLNTTLHIEDKLEKEIEELKKENESELAIIRENIKQNNDTVVENIDHMQQQVDDVKEELQQFKSMKFFARLKWLFTGKVK